MTAVTAAASHYPANTIKPARSVATDPGVLADLANNINVCASKSDDYRVTAACHLAEAKKMCARAKIPFKAWVEREIKFSYGEACKLALAGQSADPAKAIQDMRKKTAARKTAHDIKKVALRNTTPPIEIIEDFSFGALREQYVAALRAMPRSNRRKEILQLMRDVDMELRALGSL